MCVFKVQWCKYFIYILMFGLIVISKAIRHGWQKQTKKTLTHPNPCHMPFPLFFFSSECVCLLICHGANSFFFIFLNWELYIVISSFSPMYYVWMNGYTVYICIIHVFYDESNVGIISPPLSKKTKQSFITAHFSHAGWSRELINDNGGLIKKQTKQTQTYKTKLYNFCF